MMMRTLLALSMLCLAFLLGGCPESRPLHGPPPESPTPPDDPLPPDDPPDDPPDVTPDTPRSGWSECFEAAEYGEEGDPCVFEGGCYSSDGCCDYEVFCEGGELYHWTDCWDDEECDPAPDAIGWRNCSEAIEEGARTGDACAFDGFCESYDLCCYDFIECFESVLYVDYYCEPGCDDDPGDPPDDPPPPDGRPVWDDCEAAMEHGEIGDGCSFIDGFCAFGDGCCWSEAYCNWDGRLDVYRECRDVCPGRGEWESCEDFMVEGVPGDPCNEETFGTCTEEGDDCCYWEVVCVDGRVAEHFGCDC